jgi:hypothetical protein
MSTIASKKINAFAPSVTSPNVTEPSKSVGILYITPPRALQLFFNLLNLNILQKVARDVLI